MEISLNTGKMPVLPTELPNGAAPAETGKVVRPAMTITTPAFSPLGAPEEVDAATEADAATRDDSLGQLFRQVFNYAPPPMPNFL